jgi:hypothetical protein
MTAVPAALAPCNDARHIDEQLDGLAGHQLSTLPVEPRPRRSRA